MILRHRLDVFRSATTLILICLASQAPAYNPIAQAQQATSKAKTRRVIQAASGYYFEVDACVRCYRCRPCPLTAGWQRKVMRLLSADGIESFPGESSGSESATEAFGTVRVLKRFATPKAYNTMLYVGPFASENAASAIIPQLCSALDEVGVMENSCEDMVTKREGNTFYTRGSFDVSGLRVLPRPAAN